MAGGCAVSLNEGAGGHLNHANLTVLLVVLTGCSASGLTEGEAQSTFEAVNTVTDDVVLLARDAVEQGASAELQVGDADGGFSIHGSAEEGADWSGLVTIDGAVEDEGDQVGYALDVALDQVEVVNGPTLDGAIELLFTVDDFGTAAGSWSLEASLDGELDLSGAITGHASLHYDLQLTIDGWSISFTATGTINGYDVSGWHYSTSALAF